MGRRVGQSRGHDCTPIQSWPQFLLTAGRTPWPWAEPFAPGLPTGAAGGNSLRALTTAVLPAAWNAACAAMEGSAPGVRAASEVVLAGASVAVDSDVELLASIPRETAQRFPLGAESVKKQLPLWMPSEQPSRLQNRRRHCRLSLAVRQLCPRLACASPAIWQWNQGSISSAEGLEERRDASGACDVKGQWPRLGRLSSGRKYCFHSRFSVSP